MAPAPGPHDGAAERTLWEGRPSPFLAILRAALWTGVALAFVPGALYAVHVFAHSTADPSLHELLGWCRTVDQAVPLVLVAIALAALIVVNGLARVLHAVRVSFGQYFRVTTQRIVSQRGIISKDVDEIDLRVVDDVLLHQTVMQRVFGLGQIDVLSSDRSESRIVLRDVRRASHLRELIRAQVYAVSQRQLFTRPA